jgi:UDPglucose 6-dehydrogenase
VALSFIAKELGVEARLAETTDSMNRAVAQKVVDKIRPMIREGATVAVLGLSYKPFSHVTEESQGVYIAKQLSKIGIRVVGFDPMSAEMSLDEIRRNIVVLDSVEECLKQAEAVLVTTPDPFFKKLTAENFKNDRAEVLVVDFWRILQERLSGQKHIKYVAFGHGEDDMANTARLNELWGGTAKEIFQTSGK